MNGIKCNKLSIVVTTVSAYPNSNEKDFNDVITFFIQYINKRTLILSVKLPLLPRPDLPSGKGPALPVVLSKERMS